MTETTAAPGAEPKTTTLPAVKAPIRAGGVVAAFVPQDLDQIWRMARMAVVGGMAPKSLVEGKDPEEATSACAVAIMAGAELGLTPLMSLRSYAVVNGRPSLWGDGIKAVVRKSGICEYIKTGYDANGGWCEAKRKDTGEVKRVEFTFAQAKAAGLLDKKGPWSQGFKDIMAERRATFRCLNDLFADVLGGIASGEEALEDGPLVDVTPTRPTPPSPPPAPPVTTTTISETSTEIAKDVVSKNAASNDAEERDTQLNVDDDFNDDASDISYDDPSAALFINTLDQRLSAANDEATVEEIFDGLDPQVALSGNDRAIANAFSVKQEHLNRVAMIAGPKDLLSQ